MYVYIYIKVLLNILIMFRVLRKTNKFKPVALVTNHLGTYFNVFVKTQIIKTSFFNNKVSQSLF